MKPLIRLSLATVVLLSSASFVGAQAPGAVNKLEVQNLVAANTPQSNATLARHFAALADGYAADATRHKDMAKVYVGNPNHSLATSIAPHCNRLAAIATESAAAAREMAKYHEQLASGNAASAPRDTGAFQSGKGAPEPTAIDLHHLAMMANTPADHRSLEEYFSTLAKKSTADAESHALMAQAYRATARKGVNDPAAHCDRLVTLSRDAAKEATEAASLHRQLANVR